MADKTKTETLWKVRDSEGNEFGPASMASLLSWARDGRLAASHYISCDGVNWEPAASRRELEMDWVIELSPGKFHGPIHREACDELLANGTLTRDMGQFARVTSPELSPESLRAENALLQSRLESLRRAFTEKTGELEAHLSEILSENADLRAELETRDLDFDAERRGFAASESRMKAELVKAEKKAASAVARLEATAEKEKSSAADRALIAELNVKLADSEEARRIQREEFDRRIAEEKAEIRSLKASLDSANSSLRTLRIRDESLRKLVQQAGQIFAGSSPSAADDEEIVIS